MADELGHYKILERIGGAAVEVFRARDMRAGRTVALKVLPQDLDPGDRRRLLDQAARVIALSHPSIATLYEVGDEGGLFLACEFVPGQTLATLVAAGPLNPRRAIDLAVQIADALAEAHARGLVHGDLSGDTVMVTPKGRAKLLDFGLTPWTTRLRDARPVAVSDPQQDIGAVGRLLFQMLTGRPIGTGPLTPSAVGRSVPRELDPIVLRSAGNAGGRRFADAAVLAAELRSAGSVLDDRAAMAAAASAPGPGPARRGPAVWIAAAAAMGALAALAWWLR